eukprot:920087-Prymnesium_polylepis.1
MPSRRPGRPGSDDLNSAMSAAYSASVRVPDVTDALLTERAVELIPVSFSNFQIGPLEPTMRPYSTASR